ncbi:leucine-rich repeat and coiled-coil domain-containing protein 1-like [Glandiceps talaboti]
MAGKTLRVKLTGMDEDNMEFLDSPHEVVLIDSGITSLCNIPLKGHIQILNLHCNNITSIENINQLSTLKHLDLSSNQISKIEGLEGLMSLKTLNLSCNRITKIKGLTGLKSLEKLNLSYNGIFELSGLVELHGPDYKLKKLELHGNQITSVNHIVECLIGCLKLVNVTLVHDGSDNPVCQLPGYRSGVLNSLPQLEILDDVDRSGQPVDKENGLSDIPGLEDYLEYLISDGPQVVQFAFPRIDQALEKFRHRAVSSTEVTTSTTTDQESSPEVRIVASKLTSPKSKGKLQRRQAPDHEIRLEKLENQLANLIREALMQELDNERERRWKAEQAARKLVDHIKELQSKVSEEHDLQGVAIHATTRLKQALMNEKEVRTKLEKNVEGLEERLKEVTEKYQSCQQSEDEQRRALKAMETTAITAESERLKQQAHEAKKSQEYQMRAAAASRETDLLRDMVKKHEQKIQQLQELLAIREQEHRQNLDNRYHLDSKEIQDVITRAVDKERERHELDVKLHQERVNVLSKQYQDLEDEFRAGLHIEANRFRQVQDAFEKASEEASTYKQSLFVSEEKERKAAGMVSELTAMVKEQKGRLTELSKSKQEALAEAKDRLQTVEAHLDEARRRMTHLEMLKQEKIKLTSQITAQESLMEGLRAEKKLWSQELAHQGANLAQDRGRLEARIDALSAEVSALKKQQERDQDSLKIKSKMIEDQTDTIRILKEGLVERDNEIKDARGESLKIQKTLEEQLKEEKISNVDFQDRVERLTERKEELKEQLADCQTELNESRRTLATLDKKWKDKTELITTLESQVKKVKENYDEKEKNLKDERDKALAAEK